MSRANRRLDAYDLADEIRGCIEDPAVPFHEVPRLFAEARGTPTQKCDAFWMLDSEPGLFTGYRNPSTGWHSKLRSCRNHPIHGKELFAAFGGAK